MLSKTSPGSRFYRGEAVATFEEFCKENQARRSPFHAAQLHLLNEKKGQQEDGREMLGEAWLAFEITGEEDIMQIARLPVVLSPISLVV